MMVLAATIFLFLAMVFSGLEAAWRSLDPVRLRHRALRGDRRAQQMMTWQRASPRADLVLAWTSRTLATASLIAFSSSFGAPSGGFFWWMAPALFILVYALVVRLGAGQVFRRLPFAVLSRLWWLVTLAGSLWSPLAHVFAHLLGAVRPDPLPHPPASEELLALVGEAGGTSPLEDSMLQSVLNFRQLTAGALALPVEYFDQAGADRTLAELLAERKLAEATQLLVVGADGMPLGAMSCGTAALSGALTARAQSFARPLLSFASDLPGWKALAQLRRSPTPVAEVYDVETGVLRGIVTEQTVVARLLGPAV